MSDGARVLASRVRKNAPTAPAPIPVVVKWVTMRALLGVCLTAAMAGCQGGAGASLVGKTWKRQDQTVRHGYYAVAFDRDGRLVANGVKSMHTYRFDPRDGVWSDLGGVPYAYGGMDNAESDLEHNIYSYMQESIPDGGGGFLPGDSGLFRLVGDTWQKWATVRRPDGHVAFGKNGTLWEAFTADDGHLEISRKIGSGDWTVTLSLTTEQAGLKTNDFMNTELFNNNAGELFLNHGSGTLALTPDGTALTNLYDCGGPRLPVYCPAFRKHIDRDGSALLFVGGLTTTPAFWRAPPGGTPTKAFEAPAGYLVTRSIDWDDADTLYYTATADYSGGENPVLFVRDAGSSEWTRVIEMPSYSHALAVRGDGQIFAFQPMNGELLWLK